MSTQLQAVSADELLAMQRGHVRRELVRGELREMTPAGHNHGKIAMTAGFLLTEHVRANDLGVVYAAETGFKLASDPDTVRAPDVAFVRQQRVEQLGDLEGFWPGAPDLAVEVLSPGDRFAEVEEKVFDWLDAGTRMVMVVNPKQRTVTVYRSRRDIAVVGPGDILDVDEAVPGWKMIVADLFA